MSDELQGKRVLVVDDDRDILTSISAVFETTGCQLDLASNGNTAVEMAEANPPDLVVLDMMLPGRSGFLVLEKLKAKKKASDKPFVLMITGNTGNRHKMFAESLGVSGYFNKPVKLERLLDSAKKLLIPANPE